MANLEITINVHAPELAAAITKLAAALPGKAVIDAANQPAIAPTPELSPTAGAMQQIAMTAPQHTPPAAPAVAAPQSAPVTTAPQSAPVATPAAYTMEQLVPAAGELVRSGKQPELLALLGKYGVQSMAQLTSGQYDAFAADLRAMGAKI